MSKRSQRPGARHPRPNLATTPDGPGTDFASCWARLVSQWLLPSDPLQSIDLTVEDLHNGALEIFSAGLVHSATVQRNLVDKFAEDPDADWPRAALRRRANEVLATDRGRHSIRRAAEIAAEISINGPEINPGGMT